MSRKEARYGINGTTLGNCPPDEIARRKQQVRALLAAATARHKRGAPDAGSPLPIHTTLPPEADALQSGNGADVGSAPLRVDARSGLGPPPRALYSAVGCTALVAAVAIATGIVAVSIKDSHPGALCETNVSGFLQEYGALCIGLGIGLVLVGVCGYAAYLFVVGSIAIFWTHPNATLATGAAATSAANASRGNATEAPRPIDGCDPGLLRDAKTFMIVLFVVWVLTPVLNAACSGLAKVVAPKARARPPATRTAGVSLTVRSESVSGSI
jgi:hypothetical protein